MEMGSEISSKIRSAIKAKLVELGAYVDDELPDYIMVMVANKKSHTQMSEDLALFLGQNTKKFTSWLNSLLIKLQSISTEKEAPDSKKRKKSATKKKVKRRKSSENVAPTTSTPMSEKQDRDDGEPKMSETLVLDDEPELTVQADTDEFTEEMKQFEETFKPSQDFTMPETKAVNKAPSVKYKESLDTVVKEEPEEPVPKSASATKVVYKQPSGEVEVSAVLLNENKKTVDSHLKPDRQDVAVPVKRNIVTSASSQKQTFIIKRHDKEGDVNMVYVQPTPVSLGSRTLTQNVTTAPGRTAIKRKALPSLVGTVIQKPEEVEEEYDPYNPTVGNVASVVRVTARKSSVPPSMQANKSLLLKAMTDAEKSVLTARSSSVTETAARTTSSPDVRTTTSQAYVMPMRREAVTEVYKPTQLELTSRSRKEEIMRTMKYTIRNQTEVGSNKEPGKLPELKIDYRVVECELGEDVDSSPELLGIDERNVETLVDMSIPESTGNTVTNNDYSEKISEINQRVVEDGPRIIEEKPKLEVEPASVTSNTRFIVTLDGVDPDQYDENGQEDLLSDIRRTEHIQEVLPQAGQKVSPPKVKPFSISLQDSDEEDDEEMPTKRSKMAERCKFWPACVNGNACQYHHPSIPCKTFPNCKFGDKCLYIHPNCMFDARCTKRDCPYTHASRRTIHSSPPQAMQQPMVIIAAPPTLAPLGTKPVQCKFFPNCHNPQCTFVHPKPCRFGFNCIRKSTCPYHHPPFQDKERLTWSANKSMTKA